MHGGGWSGGVKYDIGEFLCDMSSFGAEADIAVTVRCYWLTWKWWKDKNDDE